VHVVRCGTSTVHRDAAAQKGEFGRPEEELAQTKTPGKDWITHGGALTSQRFSTLSQINTSNVSQPRGAWLGRLGSGLGTTYKYLAWQDGYTITYYCTPHPWMQAQLIIQ
jgi:glucose dehydrogenase